MTPFSRVARAVYARRKLWLAMLSLTVAVGVGGGVLAEGPLSGAAWVAASVAFSAGLIIGLLSVPRVQKVVWKLVVVAPRARSAAEARASQAARRAARALALAQQRSARVLGPATATSPEDDARAGAARVTAETRARVVTLIAQDKILEAWALAGQDDVVRRLTRGELLALVRGLRKRGYLARAADGGEILTDRFGRPEDRTLLKRITGERAVLEGSVTVGIDPPATAVSRVSGRVLHVVGASLPDQQSGYTLRTHYTAQAQMAAGLEPHVVTQMGFGDVEDYAAVEVDGVVYHRCPGAARGAGALDSWFEQNVRRVAAVVRKVRPAVLHAASDLINARTALIVGSAYGIPVVYESRGFWEETWLQREADRYGWHDLGALERTYGLPDVYTLRRATEDRCRREASAVVTLASVMADRIVEGGVSRNAVTVIPNGVDAEKFPVLSRDETLAAELGVDPGTVTIGYVSSLVDYEGVDVLVRAVAEMASTHPEMRVRLIVVGDGPERVSLESLAEELGLHDAIFTGQVPHQLVLSYYSLIDLFVVPRRPVDVCHLVTPLKPFEALSTGRALVLSDVRALREIADDSGAAVTFEAGSHTSLAKVLVELVGDPVRRAEMSSRGASWVRQARTWSGNATSYVQVYESIDVVPRGSGELVGASGQLPGPTELARLFADRGPVRFSSSVDLDRRLARPMLEVGWTFDPHPPIVFDGSPIDWDTLCRSNRTWEFRLHAWDFMAPVLRDYERKGDPAYLDWCRDIALSWVRRFAHADDGGTMAWYDMSLGLRAPRLAYIIEELSLRGEPWDVVSELLAAVPRHQQEFFVDAAFNPRTNHGFYTAAGQLMFSRRLAGIQGMVVMERQANERMAVVARTQFAADGGHLEHSPDYHRMLLGSFSTALDAGLIVDSEIQARVRKAEEALGWMIQPDGRLLQVGDSPARDMLKEKTTIADPTTAFIVSGGLKGAPTTDSMRVMPDSGYVFVRHPAPQGRDDHLSAGYLSFMAGFHSRAHKHADDLSFTWFDRGREIIIDAGRYGYVDLLPQDSPQRLDGYYYGSAERQFVESTRAHNTLEMGGRDHVRRGREPYGSAVGEAREVEGHFLVRGAVDHGTWSHDRALVYRPGEWLLVQDRVVGKGPYRSWLNLPSDLQPQVKENALLADLGDGSGHLWIEELSGASVIDPVSGQEAPRRGWRSQKDMELTRSWSTGFEVGRVSSHTFTTLLHFGDQVRRAVPEHPFGDI